MKSLLQLILLTGVVCLVDSVALGQGAEIKKIDAAKADLNVKIEECEKNKGDYETRQDELNNTISEAQSKIDSIRSTGANTKVDLKKFESSIAEHQRKIDNAKRILESIKTKLKNCENLNTKCETKTKELNEITKDFNYEQQKKAMLCLAEDREEENDSGNGVGRAVLEQIAGKTPEYKVKTCRVKSKDKDYREQFEKKEKEKDEKEKEIFEIDKEMINDQKEYSRELKKLEDERQDLKEAWEKQQSDKEAREQRAQNAMRENQLKIQDQVRKSNDELLSARQELEKADRRLTEELAKQQLENTQSMMRTCNAETSEYIKKMGYNRTKTKTNSKDPIGSSKAKSNDVKSKWESCLKREESRRAAVYQDYENFKVRLMNNIQSREQQLSELENEFKRQFEDYEKAMQREVQTMSKAQVNYYMKDQAIGKQIAELQMAMQQERASKTMKKQVANQKIYAAQVSLGEIGDDEATSLLAKNEAYTKILKDMDRAGCAIGDEEKARLEESATLRTNAKKKINERKADQ